MYVNKHIKYVDESPKTNCFKLMGNSIFSLSGNSLIFLYFLQWLLLKVFIASIGTIIIKGDTYN